MDGTYAAIGNDFISLYFWHKVYLLANLAQFHLPLWSPSEAGGFPFYTNPFAQACYPLNIPLVFWYKIAGGYSPVDQQVFTVLGLSIFALGLFMWLKSINKNIRAVLFATLVMSISYKITETIRFPNAVHSAAWYPWVLYAITKIMLSPSAKKAVQYGILLAFSLICLCTGGYPYFAYYSVFLFVPYFLVFLVKPLRSRLIGPDLINWKRALLTLALAGAAAGLICSPYILGVRHLVSQATDRGGKDFAYSTAHTFTFKDTLGSLVYPPAASTEGWYFFSITALLVLIVYLFACKSPVRDADGDAPSCDLTTRLFFLVWFAAVTYITYGRNSYLFAALWKYMPGFSRLRVWPRLNIILVPILAWMLSLAYDKFECAVSGTKIASNDKRPHIGGFVFVLLAGYAAIITVQLFFYIKGTCDMEWREYFKELNPQRILFIIYGCVGAAVIFLILIISRKWPIRTSRAYTTMLVILVFLAFLELRHTGTRIWTHQGRVPQTRFRVNMDAIMANAFAVPRTNYYGTITLSPAFNVGTIDNWYFDRYCRFLKNMENEREALKVLLGVYDGTRMFFSESIQHSTIASFLQDAARFRTTVGYLQAYNTEQLDWEIKAPANGYLCFIDNWESGWKCFVDDNPVEIELLFGTFKAVHLAPGPHHVRFCYRPPLLPWQKDIQ
ncbi:MAG: hypothetical protein ABSG22_05355 [Sedimentisphaerales bacterium]